MPKVTGQSESCWTTVTAPRIVVCLDLHNSMADRRARDPLPRSRRFLQHNSILYECFDDWRRARQGKESQIDLVNFVGDAGLVTFHPDARELALTFATDVIERSRRDGCLTAVGVDVGEVAVVDLADEASTVKARHAVGFPVDRAVRLSWIARPGELLSTSSVTRGLADSEYFELGPTIEPVGVSLDKWPAEQVAVCGEVLVHSVHLRSGHRGPSRRPVNALRVAEYFRRLQLGALDLLGQLPHYWGSLQQDFRRPDRWKRREALERMVEFIEATRAMDEGHIPELAEFSVAADDDPLTAFSEARDAMLAALHALTDRYHDVTLEEVEATSARDKLERMADEVVLYSRAGLRQLERRA